MQRVLTIALAFLCCSVTHARDFNVKLGGAIGGEDLRDAFHADFYSLDARYYFQAVSDSDGPYQEAAFINPASSIAVGYGTNESERIAVETDSEIWQLQGRYHSRSQGWFISAGLSREESDKRMGSQGISDPSIIVGPVLFPQPITSSQIDADSNNYSLGLGHYIGARTTLSLGYTRIERDADIRSTSCFTSFQGIVVGAPLDCFVDPFSTRVDGEADSWQVFAKHVRGLGQMHMALRGRVGYLKASRKFERRFSRDSLSDPVGASFIDSGTIADLDLADSPPFTALENPQSVSVTEEGWNAAAEITLYPRNNLGVAISYGYTDFEDVKTKAYSAALEWFVTRSVSLALRYTETDFGNNRGSSNRDNSDSVALSIGGRF